jgi:hypothetical protein
MPRRSRLRAACPLRDGARPDSGRLFELVSPGVALEPQARAVLASVPARRLESTGGAAQEHAPLLELKDRIMPVQSADGALEVIHRPGPHPAEGPLRSNCHESGGNVLQIRHHGLIAPRLPAAAGKAHVRQPFHNQELCHGRRSQRWRVLRPITRVASKALESRRAAPTGRSETRRWRRRLRRPGAARVAAAWTCVIPFSDQLLFDVSDSVPGRAGRRDSMHARTDCIRKSAK